MNVTPPTCQLDTSVSSKSMEDEVKHIDKKWSEEEMKLEKEHFKKIVNAFLYYKRYAYLRFEKLKESYHRIPERHQAMIPSYLEHLQTCLRAIDVNYKLIESIVRNSVGFLQNSEVSEFNWSVALSQVQKASFFDMEKVEVTIKQFYRDWSKEGEKERSMCYDPIIKELTSLYPPSQNDLSSIKVLVPGAGLGRLAYDIARLGYCCEGNEFSMFMLLASNFILNRSDGPNSYTVHPWVLKTCNNHKYEDQLLSFKIPDVDPSDLPYYGLFSMSAGDFLQVYKSKDKWDCVVCCFFIDTAHNIIEYVEKIYQILKPGGVWINLGPLLYHFSDMMDETSLDLSWEELRKVISTIGFEVLKECPNCTTSYIQNPTSMLQTTYESILLVARKPYPAPSRE